MNLRRRIKKLQDDGYQITVKEYSLLKFDGYHAHDAVRNFWVGMCVALPLAGLVFWCGHGIYTDNRIKSNPQTAAIHAQNEKEKRDHELAKEKQQDEQQIKEKQQYIDGCKDAGKAPGDMGNDRTLWECK